MRSARRVNPTLLPPQNRKMAQRRENIVMFPFMAQGHIIPFLALALKLEEENGYNITFVNTPLNIKKLHHSLPPNSTIRLLEIPFDSSDHGLPPNSENTETLPLPLLLRLIEASPSLKPAFEKLIANLVEEQCGRPPLCIVSDMFFGWSAKVAHEFGTFHAIFNAGGGYGMALFHSTWLNLPHLEVNSNEFSPPGFPNGYKFHVTQLPEHLRAVTGPWDFAETMFEEWLETDAMLFNTVEELDHTGLIYFRQQFPCPIWPIGPILSSVRTTAQATLNHCIKWLDTKPSNSVLYVAFGSQSTPSQSQTKQLAMALEASGKNFIWVVRPPSSFIADSALNDKEWLPDGFEHRVRDENRGLLVKKWAPQMEILSHKSVGLFLSHCGWNSVMEALSNGVPLLSWPMGAEQPYNAKMLEEETGVCVGVANGSECEVRCEEIVKKIELVMNGTEKGKEMKRKACEVKEIIRDASKNNDEGFKGSSVKSMDEFLNAALLMRKKLSKSPKNGVSL